MVSAGPVLGEWGRSVGPHPACSGLAPAPVSISWPRPPPVAPGLRSLIRVQEQAKYFCLGVTIGSKYPGLIHSLVLRSAPYRATGHHTMPEMESGPPACEAGALSIVLFHGAINRQ